MAAEPRRARFSPKASARAGVASTVVLAGRPAQPKRTAAVRPAGVTAVRPTGVTAVRPAGVTAVRAPADLPVRAWVPRRTHRAVIGPLSLALVLCGLFAVGAGLGQLTGGFGL